MPTGYTNIDIYRCRLKRNHAIKKWITRGGYTIGCLTLTAIPVILLFNL